jgi:hypothetical protein
MSFGIIYKILISKEINMKLLLVITVSIISIQSALAGWSNYRANMVCGEVKKVRNGKILKRLEPGLWGLNAKYVLTTKFIDAIGFIDSSTEKDRFNTATFSHDSINKTHTYFSLKDKFQKLKRNFKEELKKSKKNNRPLYACVGDIKVSPAKYKGSHVYYSNESIEEARLLFRSQAIRHL